MITESAYAKINLSLDITGKRPDGYHEVRMVMQTIDLKDTLTFEKADHGITLLTDSETLNKEQEEGHDNLIVKAAREMLKEGNIDSGVKITLKKNIPIAAGMAGGSADCAATLRGINRLFSLSFTDEKLKEIGVRLGADVPFCIEGGTKLSEGIGEKLTAIDRKLDFYTVICKPPVAVSTKEVYTLFDNIPTEKISHPDVLTQVKALESGDEITFIDTMGNVLEPVASGICKEISAVKEAFNKISDAPCMMSGSGPTVFSLYSDKETAERAYKEITNLFPQYETAFAAFI